ncbi:membrane lipoprotein lipid attachment site-containing protein [Clostridium sp. D2Q-14]|uniref:membrane lipoprotein lipid attachment site-containing protein n=1 Tax=Anaeromonas gelatinilytica TaxID=2683194 RepID=UPI00193BF044|nr:membrane lipoprotein lipid attachment site-containing protein [Anaeromonas gelatinilytica]MBS4534380.1 membrane lipoprotein lipid attachment site-containing protein [Anaeromonas gelatinilytica]
MKKIIFLLFFVLILAGCDRQGYQVSKFFISTIDNSENNYMISIESLKGTIEREINVTDTDELLIKASIESGTAEFILNDMEQNEIFAYDIKAEEELEEHSNHIFEKGEYTFKIATSHAKNINIELYFENEGNDDRD